jgi:hypothetical protein
MKWSPELLRLLMEEMWADEELVSILGSHTKVPVSRYPHVIALALAIRHSWRPDDLQRIARSLGIRSRDL